MRRMGRWVRDESIGTPWVDGVWCVGRGLGALKHKPDDPETDDAQGDQGECGPIGREPRRGGDARQLGIRGVVAHSDPAYRVVLVLLGKRHCAPLSWMLDVVLVSSRCAGRREPARSSGQPTT